MNSIQKRIDILQGEAWRDLIREPLQDLINLPDNINSDLELIEDCPSVKNLFDGVDMGFGTYGWRGNIDLVKKFLEKGGKYLDTAPTYGFGKVEKTLSKVLPEYEKIWVGTKFNKNYHTLNSINNSFIKSFGNLGKGNFVFLQLHWPNRLFDFTQIIQTLLKVGKNTLFENIQPKFIGLCNCNSILLSQALHIAQGKIQTLQIPFSIFRSDSLGFLIPFAKSKNVKIIGYSPFGQNYSNLVNKDKKRFLKRMSQKNNCEINQLLLSWIIQHGIIPIPRTNDVNHLISNLEAPQLKLSEEDLEELDEWCKQFWFSF